MLDDRVKGLIKLYLIHLIIFLVGAMVSIIRLSLSLFVFFFYLDAHISLDDM